MSEARRGVSHFPFLSRVAIICNCYASNAVMESIQTNKVANLSSSLIALSSKQCLMLIASNFDATPHIHLIIYPNSKLQTHCALSVEDTTLQD